MRQLKRLTFCLALLALLIAGTVGAYRIIEVPEVEARTVTMVMGGVAAPGGGWNAGLSSDDNLMAWWKFESGALTTDSSGNGGTLTASASSPTSVSGGVDGNRALFDDANLQHLYIVDAATGGILDSTGDFSIMFFVEFDAVDVDQAMVGKGSSADSDDAVIQGYIDAPTNGFRFGTGWNGGASMTFFDNDKMPSTGKVYFVCLTYDVSETTTRMYVYNVTDSSAVDDLSDSSITIHNEEGWIALGIRSDDTASPKTWGLSGYLDEVIILNRIVSDADRDKIRQGTY